MKKTLMILSFFAVISCAGAPKNGNDGQIAPEAPDRVHSSTAQAVREEADPLPVSETSVAQAEPLPVIIEPSPAEAVTEQTEPAIEAPEADTAVQPPQETLNLAALPEPPPLALAVPSEPAPLPPPPEPSRLAQTPPEPRPAPPPARPAPVPRPAPPPAPVRPAPQPRPVEPPPPPVSQPVEESLPVIAREPVPVPPPPPPPIPEPPDEIIPLPEAQGEEIIFSRIVRAIVGQLVEVPFRGTGWVFLGEQAARRGIVYDSRRLDPEGQSFVFRTEDAGAYTLKFFKQDFIRDFIFNDYVQVIVGNAPETAGTGWFNSSFDRGRVRAEPRWPNSLE